jgi:geranylgeranyl pyrophosphate synthase
VTATDRRSAEAAAHRGSSEDLDVYLDARRAEIDEALDRILAAAAVECPPSVAEAMRYSVMAGGKRLRPVLALAAADAVASAIGVEEPVARQRALPAACAVELIHTYSLVHDDLPAMDNDTLRRGRPTAHVVFGEGMAILAGDGLLTLAFEVMAASRGAQALRAIEVIARAAGPAGMVGGQAIDLQAVGLAHQLEADALRAMHARKTGALIRAAATAGALLAGAPDPLISAIDTYAAELGLAFQIVDDILDVEGEAAALGKTAGKDAAAGKPTYPALFGLDESQRMAAACVTRADEALRAAGIGGRLADIARWVVQRSH